MQYSSHIRFGLKAIVTCLLTLGTVASQAQPYGGDDDTLINMAQAWRKKDTNTLSMLLPLPVEDKQALLESPSLPQRRETLVTLIEFALRSGGANDEVLQ